jgi:hypothetical protein
MTETRTAQVVSARDWLAEHIADAAPPVLVNQPGVAAHTEDRAKAGSLDQPAPKETAPPPQASSVLDDAVPPSALRGEPVHILDDTPDPPAGDVNSGAKRAMWLLVGAVVILAVAIVGAFFLFGGGPPPPSHPAHRTLEPLAAAAPTTPNLPVPQQDQAVSFTADTKSCSPTGGSGQQSVARSPQALTDSTSDSAWVCGRGPQESLLDGQILHVQFTCNAAQPQSACSYVLNSLSVTPGWVAKTLGGKDEWLQHRVVRKLQFNFFNGNQLAADPYFLDTQDIHGPVSATLPSKVLASRVDVIILHTERPPAGPSPSADPNAPTTADPSGPGGLTSTVLGQPNSGSTFDAPAEPSADTGTDAVDATFAMSQLQFFGHSPN